MKNLILIFLFILPATAQSAHQFFDDAGRPVSGGTLTLFRLGSKRAVRLDKNGWASVELDRRESYIVLKTRGGRFVASFQTIWTSPATYRLNALSCAGLSCLPDQTTNYFPVRKPQ